MSEYPIRPLLISPRTALLWKPSNLTPSGELFVPGSRISLVRCRPVPPMEIYKLYYWTGQVFVPRSWIWGVGRAERVWWVIAPVRNLSKRSTPWRLMLMMWQPLRVTDSLVGLTCLRPSFPACIFVHILWSLKWKVLKASYWHPRPPTVTTLNPKEFP